MSGELDPRGWGSPANVPSPRALRFLGVLFEAIFGAAQELVVDEWCRQQRRCVCCGDRVVVVGELGEGDYPACTLCYSHLEAGIRWDEIHPERSASQLWSAHMNAIDCDAVDAEASG